MGWQDDSIVGQEQQASWMSDPVMGAPKEEITPAQEFAAEHPIIRTAGRGVRDVAGAVAGLADIPLLGVKTLAAGAEYGLEKTGFEGSPLERGLEKVRTTPTMTESVLGVIDEATGERLKPISKAEEVTDIGIQVLAPTGSLSTIMKGIEKGIATGINKTLQKNVKVTPEAVDYTKELAKTAIQKYGIPLRVDQVTDSRAITGYQKIAQDLPFSGAAKQEKIQTKAFNKAVAKTIGEDVDNFVPSTMKRAKKRIGEVFNKAYDKVTAHVDDEFIGAIEEKSAVWADNLDPMQYKKVDKQVKLFTEEFKKGSINAKKLASMRTALQKRIDGIKGDAKMPLIELQESVDNLLFRNLDETQQEGLGIARRQYKNLKTIEKLVAKSPTGDILQTQLANAVAHSYGDFAYGGGGDIGELARIGKEFLPKIGGSDTQFRQMLANLGSKTFLGGGAGAATVTGGVVPTAVTLIGNRAMQEFVINNPKVVQKILNKSVKTPKRLTGKETDIMNYLVEVGARTTAKGTQGAEE